MSYWLGHTGDNNDVKEAIDEVQEYYDAQDRKDWVEWVGKTLMPCLHVQIAMEKRDAVRAEQEVMDELQLQGERAE
jgi:hypothetical protein